MATHELIISEFRKQDEIISEIRERYTGLTVAKDGFKTVKAARIELKQLRCGVENLRKELKADVLERGKMIDSEAKRLTAMLSPIEDALEAEEKAEETRKAEELRRKIEEAERALQERVTAVSATGVVPDMALLKRLTPSDFSQYLADCIELAEAKRKADEEAEVARKQQEEAERIERDRLEAIRLEEVRRQQEELAIREAELAEERRIAAEELAAEQARIAAEREELRQQQEAHARVVREQQAEADRLARIEREKQEAAELAERERLAAIEEERLEAERQEKIDALRPELEKAGKFFTAMVKHAKAELKKLGNPVWEAEAISRIEDAASSITSVINQQ
jgi:hypothetical protein